MSNEVGKVNLKMPINLSSENRSKNLKMVRLCKSLQSNESIRILNFGLFTSRRYQGKIPKEISDTTTSGIIEIPECKEEGVNNIKNILSEIKVMIKGSVNTVINGKNVTLIIVDFSKSNI